MKKILLIICSITVLYSCETDLNYDISCTQFELSYDKDYDINNKWELIGFLNNDLNVEECKPTNLGEMNIEFILNNKFRAKSSCNIFEGNYYVTNADSIIIDSVATTLIYCVNDTVRDWEETYYNHLINAISYQINGNKLTLKTTSRIDIIYRAN